MSAEAQVHVIDDDDGVRASLDFLFASAGVASTSYDSPMAFLAAAEGLSSGCIVTDVRMPEMNGVELLRRVREMGVRLPVIVITGHGDVPLAVEAMKSGACDFLEKPFRDGDLLSAVRAAHSTARGWALRSFSSPLANSWRPAITSARPCRSAAHSSAE